ncbi:MAG: ATP-grasp domain-containing protein [Candidatus Methylarchaceae archaeon HK02M1]|nr:ATP-grasp domain-containing protein [Candidatus Methylarchaceae archaeon HK02M1]
MLKVAIFEYISGGGLSERKLPSSILSEGYSMLSSVLRDFKEADYHTSTLLDSRLAVFQPPLKADRIYVVNSQREFKIRFRDLLKDADASLLIAPESNGILVDLLRLSEELGVASLNCTINSVKAVCNKYRLYNRLKKDGFPVPETRYATVGEGVEKAQGISEEMGFPLIIKPIECVGCRGLSTLREISQVLPAIDKIKEETEASKYLIQELVRGVHASVSLISNGRRAMPLTLNLQIIALNQPKKNSNYIGGVVPLDHKLREVAFHTARRAVELFRGLKGYVGVDIVLSKNEPVLIEINPRLTVSYIGLRNISNINLAKIIVEASLEDRLPEDFKPFGYALFIKEVLPALSNDLLKETYYMQEVVAPSFPINNKNYAFFATKGRDLKEARVRFQKARHRLRKLLS